MSPRTLKFSGLLPWQKKWYFVSFSSISCYFTYFQLWPERKQSYSKICLWDRMHLRAIKMCPKDITILNFIYWAEQLLIPLVVFPEINATICWTDTSNCWKTKEVAVNLSPFRWMSWTERWHCCYFVFLWYEIGQNDKFSTAGCRSVD